MIFLCSVSDVGVGLDVVDDPGFARTVKTPVITAARMAQAPDIKATIMGVLMRLRKGCSLFLEVMSSLVRYASRATHLRPHELRGDGEVY